MFSSAPHFAAMDDCFSDLVYTLQKKIMIIICCVILGVVIASIVGGTLA